MSRNTERATEHSVEVWEAQRLLFTKLYKDEKKKLAEVQQIMQDSYGFYASKRQYKRRIKKWRVGKNSNAIEKRHTLASLRRSDTSLDMACVYKVNGKDIAGHKLRRYAKFHGHQSPKIACNAVKRRHRVMNKVPRDITVSVALAPGNRSGILENDFVDLRELFASVVCFIWFEKWGSLGALPSARSTLSFPTIAFREWTRLVLRTTCLTANHVFLAALYIYRLKSFNPTVIGEAGSEYRLASTALMLSNKFLDDKFYTNRTWAEVTGLSIQDINIMEMEFLSNMRYNLLVHPRDWDFWLTQLVKLQSFLRQTPATTFRVIEIPYESESNHETVVEESLTTVVHEILPRDGHNNPEFEIPDITHLSADKMLNLSVQENLDSSAQCNVQSETLVLQSNGLMLFENVPTGTLEDERNISTSTFSRDVDESAVMTVDDDALELVGAPLPNIITSPSFLETLTMDCPTPVVDDMDAGLTWRPFFRTELREGPIPDLETFVDPYFWEDSWDMSYLGWHSAPSLESFDPDTTQPEQEKWTDDEDA